MKGIATRDDTALRKVYERHAALVMTVCVRVLRDRGEAEDVLVDVFWELWDRFDRFDVERGTLRTYLTTLARSRAIDRRRALSSRGAGRTQSLEQTPPAVAHSPGPVAGVINDEHHQLVRQALDTLEPDQRKAIECAYYDGLTHSEIAEHLNKPLGSVKTYIRTGVNRLKAKLVRGRTEDEKLP